MYFWRLIGRGFKLIWKGINLIREITLNLFFLFIVLIIISSVTLFNNPQSQYPTSSQEGILVLDIEGSIVDSTHYEQDVYKLINKINGGKKVDHQRENSLFELAYKIEQAAYDPNIKGMVLKLDDFVYADLPSLQYIGKYLEEFRTTHKPIYAIGSQYNQMQYYLASFADKIYLLNQGTVSLYGLSSTGLYYKELLDNLKVNTHIFRVGTYKSAIEPFTRNDMSNEARENLTRWTNIMWKNYLADISEQAGLDEDELVPSAQDLLARVKASGSLTQYALDHDIVDEVVSYSQFKTQLKDTLFNYPDISIYDYSLNPSAMQSFTNEAITNQSLIAVVFVNGTLAKGNNEINIAGSDTITKQLSDITNNPNIEAVVVRVNSPGGSVFASESIRSELAALRNKHIPVVISMGGMAASGGYWISTESDYIIASPNTITGSIGIFGIVPTFEDSLSHIGIHADGVSTSPLANASLVQPLSPEYSGLIQMNIESGYNEFLNLVASSRNMTPEQVDAIAQGQVWLGEEAQTIGLVDQLGNFDDAIKKAASLAGLTHYQIDWQKPKTDFFQSLLSDYSAVLPKSMVEVVYHQLPISQQLTKQITLLDQLNDPQNRYVYCLNCASVN